MGVVIESEIWEPKPFLYLFLFSSCLFSLLLFSYFTRNPSKNTTFFDLGCVFSKASDPFGCFQRRFLLVYSLASVIEGLESVFGEFEYGYFGISREQMVMAMSVGCAASLFLGSFFGVISDVMGHKKACNLFFILHLFVGVLKSVAKYPSTGIPNICLALASSISSFSFEMWMVTEHEKLGRRKELLSETFWLMTFSESASLIGSQALANSLVSWNSTKGIVFPSIAAGLLALICCIYISRKWNETLSTSGIWSYKMAFSAHVLSDKRIWLLVWSQACLHFSVTIFWILWTPTTVADGREVHLSKIYPCLLGARMLGSSTVPWFVVGPLSIPTEDCLLAAFVAAGMALSLVAYDYQEIGFLVTLFCIFHACVGLIFPSLARMRTMIVPNELRAGMMSLSLAPANAAVLFVLIQGGYYRSLGNSTIMVLSAFGLLTAAGCMHFLKRWRKQAEQNCHKF